MKRPILLLPLPAWILAIAMFGFGGLPIAVAGLWVLPVAVTIVERGWHRVIEIPTEMHIFPKVPTWVDPQSVLYQVVNYGTLILGLAAGSVGLLFSIKVWRCLVVKKFHWMTEEEVEAYLKRVAEKG